MGRRRCLYLDKTGHGRRRRGGRHSRLWGSFPLSQTAVEPGGTGFWHLWVTSGPAPCRTERPEGVRQIRGTIRFGPATPPSPLRHCTDECGRANAILCDFSSLLFLLFSSPLFSVLLQLSQNWCHVIAAGRKRGSEKISIKKRWLVLWGRLQRGKQVKGGKKG